MSVHIANLEEGMGRVRNVFHIYLAIHLFCKMFRLIPVFAEMLFFSQYSKGHKFKDRVNEVPELGIRKGIVGRERGELETSYTVSKHSNSHLVKSQGKVVCFWVSGLLWNRFS